MARPRQGITPWMLLLAAAVVLPILLLLGTSVRDVSRQISVGRGELDGLGYVGALQRVFDDASAPVACDGRQTSANLAGDVGRVDALERRNALGRDDWRSALSSRDSHAADGGFAAQLTGLFPIVADRSGLTYDPDTAGIDLADALTYRLPVAIDQLERARSLLCEPNAQTTATRLQISLHAGHAEGYLSDGLGETLEAAGMYSGLPAAVGADGARTRAATTRALDALAVFAAKPSPAGHARASVAAARGVSELKRLARDIDPALGGMIARRLDGLEYRRTQLLVLGTIAIVAAAFIVLFGTRTALQRAELGRVRRTALEFQYHAMHDALTGLPNRSAMLAKVDAALDRSRAHRGGAAVLFVDLDNFKLINDSLGHAAGDSVLCIVAERLRAVCATEPDLTVARFGGDEFAMLLAEADGSAVKNRVATVVRQITTTLADPVTIEFPYEQRVVITASVGVAVFDSVAGNDRCAADLLREADAAMYEAKSSGRAQAATFGPAMRERAMRKLRMMTDFRGAAERGELALEFQPFVCLLNDRPVGSEALVRWNHPEIGLLKPDNFLPLAEETGAIVQIGRWVFREALRRYAAHLTPPGAIHVNVSARELLESSLDGEIAALLERYAIEPSRLAIEVVEGSLIRSGDGAEVMLRRLRAMGAKIWIDDFGVEYSSLRYLHRLPIDGVKIDRTFVAGADGGLASPSIVRLIIELAQSLNLEVVAEGIQTTQQRDALIELGCTHGQGFLFAKAPRLLRSVEG